MSGTRAATSYDVARRAGISQATVSAVLSGTRSNIRVSEETRQRVVAAAAALDYSPHPYARALQRQRSGVIAFVPQLAKRRTPLEHPVERHLGEAITYAAAQSGYRIVEERLERGTPRTSDDLLRFLRHQRVEGVIFYSPDSAAEVQGVVDADLPVVQLMRPQAAVTTDTIIVHVGGIAAAVDHLVAHGHRRIALLGHGDTNPVNRDRVDTFNAALARHGITVPQEYLRLGTYAFTEGRGSTVALLALPHRPTAIFAAADALALGSLHALHDARIRVPDGMSLVSYDDVYSAFLYPPLTSVAQPLNDIATHALALLVERLEQPDDTPHEPTHLVLPTHLHVRDSTGPARSGIPTSV